jgi:Helicase conserved C-terminal domain
MYALRRTCVNFRFKIEQMQSQLALVTPDANGLKQFLLLHYGFTTTVNPSNLEAVNSEEMDEDYAELEEEEELDGEERQEKRHQLRQSIEIAINHLRTNSAAAKRIYDLMQSHCEADLIQLQEIEQLLADEFVKDHKRSQVTHQVQELVRQGKKVLLISTFADTVVDYYRYMTKKLDIATAGIGMAIGSTKYYQADDELGSPQQFKPHNVIKGQTNLFGIKRQELFRLFAPVATCRAAIDRPPTSEEIMVLIGSETLSVGQNMHDADYLINIDLPWNPMVLEQRIGRIDRMSFEDMPADIPPKLLRTAIGKLDGWKESKDVHKLLQSYSDGAKSQLPNPQFLTEFLVAVDRLNLLPQAKAKRASLKLTVNAVLFIKVHRKKN